MKTRRILSVILAVVIVLSCAVAAGVFGASADSSDSAYQDMLSKTTAENGYGLAPSVNEGTILQAWNWSFNNVKANLELLAKQGFTTIQVSPPNEIKSGTSGAHILEGDNSNGWWMFYQPAGFQLNNSANNALGTKAEFESMCTEAHKYGIKIIVDAVINHMGTKNGDDYNTSTDPMTHVTPLAQTFEPEIYNNKLFHSPWEKMTYKEDANRFSQYESTYDLTRNCTSGLPDLMTEDSRVQNAIYEYMDELIASGADGFRFDAAKHIETSEDIEGLSSDFWENTLGKVRTKYSDKEIFAYGEILNNCGVNRPFSMYTKLFDVTDSSAFYDMKDVVSSGNGNATPYYPSANFTSDNVILWNESHDTYADGSTTYMSVTQRGKMWALCAGRAGITTVYLARPDDATNLDPCYTILLGDAKQTAWSNATTKAINQFHNYFLGADEYCTSNTKGWALIERGNSGAILVHRGTANAGNANLANHVLKDGTYKDSITGNTFVVSGGRIRGTVGASGVACIYYDNDQIPTSTEPTENNTIPTKDGYSTVMYTNSVGWDGEIYLYYWETGKQGPEDWPGVPMEFYDINEYEQVRYIGFIPEPCDNVIINNNVVQMVDTHFEGHIGIYALNETDDKGHYLSGTYPLDVNPKKSYLIGDVDLDEDVAITDATAIQRYLASLVELNAIQQKLADVDEDNDLSIIDATAIQRWLASLENDGKKINTRIEL